ncbi:spore germination protein KA [Natronincola peptidivorans]|uniref:Spore germination protein KA n=1 Tax=Natronincola peptidivorans TaxID=426128 RepID=A0A1I0CVJ2_9FIRM|nr:spore germination protein [Natronincola peptidivorans]SET23652.1 spore germination protein KA [Natronincola peptidivorans]
MFRKIIGIMRYLKYSPVNRHSLTPIPKDVEEKLDLDIEAAKKRLEEIFHHSEGLIIRPFKIRTFPRNKAFICYIDGLVDTDAMELNVLKPLMSQDISSFLGVKTSRTIAVVLVEEIITSVNTFLVGYLNQVVDELLKGGTVIVVDGSPSAIVISAAHWETRGVTEPSAETVIRGPREGFNEDLITNITLIRRKVKSPKLKFEYITRGIYSKTKLAICYIDGIANPKIVEELKNRIEKINIDVVLESGYIEEFIDDQPFCTFPAIGTTEKPDVVVGKIFEGRIAVLCDGTPFVLTVPHLLVEHLQTSEDYYMKWVFASTIRLFRLMALVITSTLPAIYVGVQTFHHEIIPFKLFLSIMSAREPIPISSLTEALLMIVIFKLINEAGIRMPTAVGQAISVVGAIVLGQAVVEAGVASPLMIIVVALTAITSFVVPGLQNSIFLIRILLLVLASIVGFYGIAFGLLFIFVYMCNLRSFGVPYLSPFAPTSVEDLEDTFIRAPLWTLLIKRR